MITLSDLFIGNYKLTQGWGARPEVYAKWGHKGHNGWDFIFPRGTQVIATEAGKVLKVVFEDGGFGNYVKLLHKQGEIWFVTVYAHLERAMVEAGQKVRKFQLLGTGDSTGFSSADHLHFGIYFSDKDGNKLYPTNGYGGYHDPGDKGQITWKIENPTEPAKPLEEAENLVVTKSDWEKLLGNSLKWDKVWAYFELPGDPANGSFEDVQRVVSGIKSRSTDMENKLTEANAEITNRMGQVGRLKDQLLEMEKQNKDLSTRLTQAQKMNDVLGEEQGGLITKLAGKEIDNKRLQNRVTLLEKKLSSELSIGELMGLILRKIARR